MTDIVGAKTLEIMSSTPWYNNWLISKMKPFIKGDILEAGAGIGNMTKLLSSLGKVTAVDYNPLYVKVLKKEGLDAGFGDLEKGTYFFNSKKKFDSIVSTNVLEHIKNDKKTLNNLYKLLNPRGNLILIVPAHTWAFGELDTKLGHFRRYTTKGLSRMYRKAGFRVIECRYINWVSILGWAFSGRVLKSKMIPEGQLKLFGKLAPYLLWIEKYINLPIGQSVFIVGQKV